MSAEAGAAAAAAGQLEAPPRGPERWYERGLGPLAGIDLRSLALLRIATACVLLADLLDRSRDLFAMYTDDGVMPRSDWAGMMSGWQWSLHMASGKPWFQAAMMVLAAVFGLMMLVGYRTRLATIASYLLLLSIQGRNTMVSHGGDTMFRVQMFWMCFLPLGMRFSVDAALRPAREAVPRLLVSLATLGLLLQLALVYPVSALLKTDVSWRGPVARWANQLHGIEAPKRGPEYDFIATYHALDNASFANDLGRLLLDYPTLTRWITAATWWFELLGPLLIFAPFWHQRARLGLVLGYWGFHIGLYCTMRLGIFPWVACAFWCAVLPGLFWDTIARWGQALPSEGLRLRHAGGSRRAMREALCWRQLCGLEHTVPVEADPALAHGWVLETPEGVHHGAAALARLARSAPIPALGLLLAWVAAPLLAVAALAGRCVSLRESETPRWRPTPLGQSVCALLIALLLLLNAKQLMGDERWREVPRHEQFSQLARISGLHQGWKMFAPRPMTTSGWFAFPATLNNGRRVDLWVLIDGSAAQMTRDQLYQRDFPAPTSLPPGFSSMWPNVDWQKFIMHANKTGGDRGALHRSLFRRWLVAEWDRRLDRVEGMPTRQQISELIDARRTRHRRLQDKRRAARQSGGQIDPRLVEMDREIRRMIDAREPYRIRSLQAIYHYRKVRTPGVPETPYKRHVFIDWQDED